MIYLASPYSHPDPLIMRTRFLLAEQCAAALLQQHQWVYSPIVHCHALAEKYRLPTDFAFWRDYDINMLRRADVFGILAIDGWRESKGVTAEVEAARAINLPLYMLNEDGECLA